MKVFRGLPPPAHRTPCALTIGNFDGVHRGHQALLATAKQAAQARGLPLCVMTFEPHPKEFFAPAKAPPRIANLRDKMEALRQCGVDRVIVEHFNARFAVQTPEEFVRDILVSGLHARWVLVGDDFRFGARRAGDFTLLQETGWEYGFEVARMHTVTFEGIRISSSEIRNLLSAGDLATTKALLGRPYMISGRVVHGHKLGRNLGFPTLNLRIADRMQQRRPALVGIFVVQVHGLADQPLPGVASLGARPTVDDTGRYLLEVHVLDFQQEVYGKLIRVEFLKKLRDEARYDTLDALTEAIKADAAQARAWFSHAGSHLTASPRATTATDRIS